MSNVQTQIDRIITAVDAAHAKVAEKGGTTARPYLVGNLADAIGTIPTGVSLPTLSNEGAAGDLLTGKQLIDGDGSVVEGAMPTATQATPSITVSSGGLITASATQTAGYVAAGTKSATKQLTTQAAQTITPGTADKTIASGRYLTGAQTIKGDANLVAENIKSGVSIFGVAGSLEAGSGGGTGGAVETCTVTVTILKGSAVIPGFCTTCYVDANKAPIYANMNTGTTSNPVTGSYTVCKDSLCTVSIGSVQINNTSGAGITTAGACQIPTGLMGAALYAGTVPIYVTGDCEITITT